MIIKFKFDDGTISEVEVDDETGQKYLEEEIEGFKRKGEYLTKTKRGPSVGDIRIKNNPKKLLEIKELIIEPVDRYVLLFVFNAGNITDLSDKKAILKGVNLYDAFDPLNRYDTAWELFIELNLLEPDEC